MITNLLATVIVTLTTNTTERFPQHAVSDPRLPSEVTYAVFVGHMENDPNPKVKWLTTTVKRVTSFSFDWEGKTISGETEEIISQKEEEFSLLSEWKKKE